MKTIVKMVCALAMIVSCGCNEMLVMVPTPSRMNITDTLTEVMDHADREDYGKAICLLDKLDEQYPDEELVLLVRGTTLRKAGSYDKAIVDLTRAVEIDPDNCNAYAQRAFCFQQQEKTGWPNKAIEDAKQSIKISNNALARLMYGNALFALGDAEASLQHYNYAVAMNRESYSAYGGRALALVELGNLTQAQADLGTALSFDMPIGDRIDLEERAKYVGLLVSEQKESEMPISNPLSSKR